jgi:acetyl esterase/lipase
MFYYDASCAVLNDTLRPTDLPFNTPEISAVLASDVGSLPPQLVLYSNDEILGSDSVRWIKKSRAAGVEITEHAPSGEMHTFAVGWPVCGRKTQDQCDGLMLNYIFKHTNNA